MPKRGEVWLADLGMAAKVRPVLVLSVPFSDPDYALITVVPHTTSSRNANFEVNLSVSALNLSSDTKQFPNRIEVERQISVR